MADAWEERKKTKEEEYFDRQNKDALARQLSSASRGVSMAITGICPADSSRLAAVTIAGFSVQKCPKCAGVWLGKATVDSLAKSDATSLSVLVKSLVSQ